MATSFKVDDNISGRLSNKMKDLEIDKTHSQCKTGNESRLGSRAKSGDQSWSSQQDSFRQIDQGQMDLSLDSKELECPDNAEDVEIDLTNPEDLLEKLDGVDLTDEQYETLMAQALSVNRQLKQQMREMGLASRSAENTRHSRSVTLPPIPGASRHSSSSSLPRDIKRESSGGRWSEKTAKR